MSTNPLRQLRRHGQSVWLDDLSRELLENGTLERLVNEDGLSGITSNPKIFRDAIASGERYDSKIRELAERGLPAERIVDELVIRDVRDACDLLTDVHLESGGDDGFVSIEVSPHLARDPGGTVEEAVRLWDRVDRPNVLIKIPGTAEGLTAIRACLARGIHVNVTLLFSLDRYREVLDVWFDAMRERLDRGEPLSVLSVASFFLSRIDAKIDPMLDERGEEARLVRGRAAIASAKLAHEIWRGRIDDDNGDWVRLREAGAAPQKLLWASTSTKDPGYEDTRYVEALVAPRTISTMPRETLDAFRDHGRVSRTLDLRMDEQRTVLKRLADLEIDLQRVTDELTEEGIDKFVRPYDELVEAVARKAGALAEK